MSITNITKFPETESWAVDDLSPHLLLHIFQREGGAREDLTGSTQHKFYLYDVDAATFKINGDTNISIYTGGPVGDGTDGILEYNWQSGDTDTANRYRAWATYLDSNGDLKTTRAREVLIQNAWERV